MDHPAKAFTTTYLDKIKSETKLYRVRDVKTSGLYISVRPSGSINWLYRYTFLNDRGKRSPTFYTFGKYTNKGVGIKLTLAEARDECDSKFMPLAVKGINLKTHYKNNPLVIPPKNTLTEIFRHSFKERTGLFPEEFDPKIPGFVDSYKIATAIDNDKVGYTTASDMKSRVKRFLLPVLGERNVLEIIPNDLAKVIKSIKPIIKTDKDGIKSTCHRFSVRDKLFQDMQYIFEFAKGQFPEMLYPPTLGVNMQKLTKGSDLVKKPRVSTTDVEGIQRIVWKIYNHINTSTRMTWQMKAATLALALTHLRPGELTSLRWTEIDFDKALIDIPGRYGAHTEKPEKRMKMGLDHLVPISRQLKGLLKYAKECSKEERIISRYVFPSSTKYSEKNQKVFNEDGREYIDKPITVNGLEDALKAMGVCNKTELTPHGWRAMASTSYNGGLFINGEKKYYKSQWVEVALSHKSIKKKDGGAMAMPYNRAKYLPERIEMTQVWADFLLGLVPTSLSLTSPRLKSLSIID
jgi:integrase